jgi:hypothetical protein
MDEDAIARYLSTRHVLHRRRFLSLLRRCIVIPFRSSLYRLLGTPGTVEHAPSPDTRAIEEVIGRIRPHLPSTRRSSHPQVGKIIEAQVRHAW